jgi:four helix bundle protein
MKGKNAVREKSFALAVRILKLNEYLSKEKKEFAISRQLVRSGTNPGAMVREALNAESDADFIHKMSVAQKETDETLYWLELLFACGYLTENEYYSIRSDAEEVLKLLRSIILTRKAKLSPPHNS